MKTGLVHTSNFTKLIAHKILGMLHRVKIFSIDNVMIVNLSCLCESYEPAKWQIWKCELGWFFSENHIMHRGGCSRS